MIQTAKPAIPPGAVPNRGLPMRLLSATDVAIAKAIKADTLRVVARTSRFDGSAFVSIEDAFGVIEVAADGPEADARISAIRAAL